MRLRNALVHFTPEWLGTADAKHVPLSKALEDLKPPFDPTPFLDQSEQLFPRRWMSYSAAKWAVELVRDFAIDLAATNGWRCDYPQFAARLALP